MKSKKLGILLLLVLALTVTTGTFAYWASSVTGDADSATASVTIGQGGTQTTTVTLGTGATTGSGLVPTAYGTAGTDDTATFNYTVDWDADAVADANAGTGFAGTLAVTFSNKSLGTLTATEIDNMFTFTVTSGDGAIPEGGSNAVVITVVFANEPANETIYNQVANGTLSFDITFTVTVD